MKEMLKKIGKVALMLAVMVGFCYVADALAQSTSDDVVNKASGKMGEVFNAARKIIFIVSAFVLIGVAVGAIFGKIEWKKVGLIAIGLGILLIASAIIKFIVGENNVNSNFYKTGGAEDLLN